MWDPQLLPAHSEFKCFLPAAPVMSRVPYIDSSAAVTGENRAVLLK